MAGGSDPLHRLLVGPSEGTEVSSEEQNASIESILQWRIEKVTMPFGIRNSNVFIYESPFRLWQI
jgi:hypothetical protein